MDICKVGYSSALLYYIFILHQTTTTLPMNTAAFSCIISSFYIKPQLKKYSYICAIGCIISSFYIKPQPELELCARNCVVLYLHSTSNHNEMLRPLSRMYVVLYLHSTSNHNHPLSVLSVGRVVLYLHSTSNHNTLLVS